MKAVLLLVACAVLVATAPPQRLATVAVSVEDVGGRLVEGLTAADFSVQVDGQSVTVEKATLYSADLSLAVLLDLTTSAAWPGAAPPASVEQTVGDHVLALLGADVAVLVGSFGRSVRWSGEFSTDRSEQRRRLRSALSLPQSERTGPSPVWDAVHDALLVLQSRPGRHAVLLVTDGQATGNRLGLADVADKAIAAAVTINIVFTGPSGLISQTRDLSASVRPDRALVQLANGTGGYYSPKPPSQRLETAPVDALRKAATAMRSVYRLEFMAPVKPGFQRIVVATRNPDQRVRAPLGFKSALAPDR